MMYKSNNKYFVPAPALGVILEFMTFKGAKLYERFYIKRHGDNSNVIIKVRRVSA